MDPMTAQQIGERLAEIETSLASMAVTYPILYAAISAVLMAVILTIREVLARFAGWPAQAVEAVASAVMGRVEATADAFFTTKAANLARKSDLDLIVDEVKETRKATALIEQEFGRRKFVSERSYDFAAKAVERIIEPLFVCLEGHERLLASVKAEREENDADYPMTLPKLSNKERAELHALCGTKHDEFRRARAMAPVVLGEQMVTALAEYDAMWSKLHSTPWERWEDDEEGHLSEIVKIERTTYTKLCDAARELLLERPKDKPTPSTVTAS